MSHDYNHYPHPKPGPMPIPTWVWIFALVAISSFAGLLYYLDLYDKGRIGTDHKENLKQIFNQAEPHSDATKPESDKPKDKKTEFNFYDLLPSMEVVIPDREVAVRDEEVPKQADTKTKIPFILQAGSFRDPKQADRLKAGLALLGIESTIETVNIKDSGEWHRVRIGPFTNMREIDKVRSRMRANNIEPILLRDKS